MGATESCLDDHTRLFETGIFYPTEYLQILHLNLHAALAPLPLPRTVLKRPFPHLVISALASGSHCVKCALKLLVKDFLQECTIVITIKALSQHLGILPLCNVSNHDSETFTQRVFMHPQTVVVSYLLVPLRADHNKGFFQLTGVLWAPEQMYFYFNYLHFFFLHLEIKTNHIFLCHRCFVKIS